MASSAAPTSCVRRERRAGHQLDELRPARGRLLQQRDRPVGAAAAGRRAGEDGAARERLGHGLAQRARVHAGFRARPARGRRASAAPPARSRAGPRRAARRARSGCSARPSQTSSWRRCARCPGLRRARPAGTGPRACGTRRGATRCAAAAGRAGRVGPREAGAARERRGEQPRERLGRERRVRGPFAERASRRRAAAPARAAARAARRAAAAWPRVSRVARASAAQRRRAGSTRARRCAARPPCRPPRSPRRRRRASLRLREAPGDQLRAEQVGAADVDARVAQQHLEAPPGRSRGRAARSAAGRARAAPGRAAPSPPSPGRKNGSRRKLGGARPRPPRPRTRAARRMPSRTAAARPAERAAEHEHVPAPTRAALALFGNARAIRRLAGASSKSRGGRVVRLPLDHADLVRALAHAFEPLEHVLGLLAVHDQDHADAAVEDAQHLRLRGSRRGAAGSRRSAGAARRAGRCARARPSAGRAARCRRSRRR